MSSLVSGIWDCNLEVRLALHRGGDGLQHVGHRRDDPLHVVLVEPDAELVVGALEEAVAVPLAVLVPDAGDLGIRGAGERPRHGARPHVQTLAVGEKM